MYEIQYASERIPKYIANLPPKDSKNIIKNIETKLKNYNHKTQGIRYVKELGRYRLRVGNYRIIFSANKKEKIIEVYIIDNRRLWKQQTVGFWPGVVDLVRGKGVSRKLCELWNLLGKPEGVRLQQSVAYEAFLPISEVMDSRNVGALTILFILAEIVYSVPVDLRIC